MKKIYMIVALAFVFTMASFAQGKLLSAKALKYDGKVVKSMKIQKAEAEGDELITPPESAEIQDWTLTGNYISNGTAYTNGNAISVAFDGDEVWIKGIVYTCPDGWIKGTLADGVAEFPNGQYVGSYSSYSIYACGSDDGSSLASLKFAYDDATKTLTLTNYYIENTVTDALNFFFYSYDIVLQKVVEAPAAPIDVTANPSTKSAEIAWTEAGNSTKWNLQYRKAIDPSRLNKKWDFEDEAQLADWSFIDADGDGYNWTCISSAQQQSNSGIGVMASASYASGSALTPDNWLITPKVTLGGKVSFYACGQDPSYAAEVFAVYVCTGDPTNVENFEKISDDITATGAMTNYEFDLSAYEGEGYVAFRHYNVTDMFRLNIDDVKIEIPGGIDEPEWTLVEGVEEIPYTIEGLSPATDYEVQVQAVGEIVSAWTASTLFTTLPVEIVIPIEVTAENIGMHNADIKWTGHEEDRWNLRYRPSSSAPISEIVYDFPLDGYEEQIEAGWSIYDADGDGNNWGLAYSSDAQDDVCFYSASYANNEALTPDNWLFTPEFELGGSVSFKSWNRSDSYPDTIAVYLIEAEELTEEAMANAKQLGEDIVPPAAGETYEFDLSEYSGKGIIAFRHYHCSDNWAVYIDDVVFKMHVDKEAEENSWTYVNDITEIPYTLEGLEPETQYDVEVQSVVGEETSDWSELYQFTTEGLEIPTDVTADNITESSADISWTGGEEQEWNIRYHVAAPEEERNIATIILTAGDVWQDGSGYQMLIDADATAFGTIIPETGGLTASGDVSDEIYGEFEYKIPENADGVLTTENIVINNSVTIQIPAGTYDFCITNPTADDRMWIASANGNIGGRYDDYEFEGGKIYEFTVSLGGNNDQVDVEITDAGGEWTYINGVTEIPFTIDGLDPETTYEAEVQAAEGEHTSGWSEPVLFTTLVSTAVETVEKVATDKDVWYNINGVKLTDKPTQKGVYIKNGKKVVVK